MTISRFLMTSAKSSSTPLPTSKYIIHLDASDFNGTTWTAKKGGNPTKYGTISRSTDDGYACASFGSDGYFYYSSVTLPSSLCVFAVLKEASSTSAPLIVEQGTNANSLDGFYFYSDQSYPYTVYRNTVGNASFWRPDNDWLTSGSRVIGAINWDGSAFTLSLNGTAISTTRTGATTSYASNIDATAPLYIGSRGGNFIFFNQGKLFELIIANALTSSEFNSVMGSLKSKYGIT